MTVSLSSELLEVGKVLIPDPAKEWLDADLYYRERGDGLQIRVSGVPERVPDVEFVDWQPRGRGDTCAQLARWECEKNRPRFSEEFVPVDPERRNVGTAIRRGWLFEQLRKPGARRFYFEMGPLLMEVSLGRKSYIVLDQIDHFATKDHEAAMKLAYALQFFSGLLTNPIISGLMKLPRKRRKK